LLVTCLAPIGAVHAVLPGTNGRIAFTRGDFFNGTPASVFTANSNGSDQQQVPLPPGIQVEVFSTPVWSPDGTKLLISHTFRLDSNGQCCRPFRPAILSPDGSGFKLLRMTYAPSTWIVELGPTRVVSCAV